MIFFLHVEKGSHHQLIEWAQPARGDTVSTFCAAHVVGSRHIDPFSPSVRPRRVVTHDVENRGLLPVTPDVPLVMVT